MLARLISIACVLGLILPFAVSATPDLPLVTVEETADAAMPDVARTGGMEKEADDTDDCYRCEERFCSPQGEFPDGTFCSFCITGFGEAKQHQTMEPDPQVPATWGDGDDHGAHHDAWQCLWCDDRHDECGDPELTGGEQLLSLALGLSPASSFLTDPDALLHGTLEALVSAGRLDLPPGGREITLHLCSPDNASTIMRLSEGDYERVAAAVRQIREAVVALVDDS